MATVNKKMTAIADAIRDKTGGTDPLTLDDMAEHIPNVYDAGKQVEWDEFWDVFQQGGSVEMSYQHAFSNGKFTDKNYNPKYALRFSSTSVVAGQYVFASSAITDTKVEIIAGLNKPLAYCFYGCDEMRTIRKLTVNKGNTFTNSFQNCGGLMNIIINGEIGNNVEFQWSPLLTHESLMSIIEHLGTVMEQRTCTLGTTNLAKLTDAEKAIATQKGWTLA